jgi:hypothetical protein
MKQSDKNILIIINNLSIFLTVALNLIINIIYKIQKLFMKTISDVQ